jgi:hypothetical protein
MAMVCAYFTAMPETGEKSVARRIFFKDSETAGSSVFMRAPHSSLIKSKCSKPVTAKDVMSITRLIAGKSGGQTLQKGGLIGSSRDGEGASKVCGGGKLVPENGRGVSGLKRF